MFVDVRIGAGALQRCGRLMECQEVVRVISVAMR